MSRRAGRYALQQARQHRWRYVRANWRAIIGICFVCLIAAVALVVAMGRYANRDIAFFTAGTSVLGVGIVVWFCTHSTYARHWFDGAEGERFTAGAFRRLRLRGWRSINDVEFLSGNVDHVIAGPRGAFAVETKWTSVLWRITDSGFDDRYARKAVRQCRFNARLIGSLLRGHYEINCELQPLLVVWGPGRPVLDGPVCVDGVLVVPGQLLRRAVLAQPEVMDTAASRALIGALREFTRSRDRQESTRGRLVARFAGARAGRQPVATSSSAALGELRLQPAR